MKRIIKAMVLCFVIASLSINTSAIGAVPEKVMMSTESVVRILAKYSDGYGTGTGFVIKSDRDETLIITNYHVVEDNPYNISIWLGEEEQINAEILVYTKQKDLCVLKLAQKIALKPVSLSKTPANQGDAIYAVGFPAAADVLSDTEAHTSQDATITDGIVSARRQVSTTGYGSAVDVLQISAAINPGNSGGPLFNIKGEVVGVNTYGIADSQGIFGAIDIAELEAFLNENGIAIESENGIPMIVIVIGGIILLAAIGFIMGRKMMRISKTKTTTVGISLRKFMEDYPRGLGINDAISLMLPVALRLRDMHNEGKAHLQVSPDRIVVDTTAMLLAPTESESDRYSSGFAAKEIYGGTGKGSLSDIYSFCAVLFYVAFGNAPINSLQRDSEVVCDFENIDPGFCDLLNLGMALRPEDRFDDMQKLILKMSVYNIKPFERKKNASEEANDGHSIKSKTHRRKFKKQTALIVVAVILILVIAVYSGGYGAAIYSAKEGRYDIADQLLFIPQLTALHDSRLLVYIEAGQLMNARQYEKARELYESIPAYLESDTMVLEANYCRAAQLVDANDFALAIRMYQDLGRENYKDSVNKILDTRYRNGLYILYEEKDYLKAYNYLSHSDYKKIKDIDVVLGELTEFLYIEAIDLYYSEDYYAAGKRFEKIRDYKDGQKYYILTAAHNNFQGKSIPQWHVEKLVEIFYFEDASDVLLSNDNYAQAFLEGKWRTKNGGRYFIMEENGGISYNLPWIDYGDYYTISDGDLLLYPKDNRSASRTMFTFLAITPDCIEVYCHKDGSVHTLFRQ